MSPLSKENLPFFLRKLHSLTGTIPLGLFVVVHVWNNSKALRGERAYDSGQLGRTGGVFFTLLEVVGLWAPLAFHTTYGLAVAYRERADLFAHPSPRGRAWVVDRVSSVAAFLFIFVHAFEFRVPVALGTLTTADFFSSLCDRLSSTTALGIPVTSSLYLVGLGATSYHLAHGLAALTRTWGIPREPRARRGAVVASIAIGVVTFLLGATTVLYFATGSGIPGISRNEWPRGADAF